MLKVFLSFVLSIVVLLFAIGCGGTADIEDPYAVEPPDDSYNAETSESNDKIIFDFNWENWEFDEALVDGEPVFRVAHMTEELLSAYDYYVEFTSEERGLKIAILPYIMMYDFQWIEISRDFPNDGTQFYQRNVLYSAGDLPSGVPFVVYHWQLGTLPHRAISFLDAGGEKRYFAICFSNSDGPESFVIIELQRRNII